MAYRTRKSYLAKSPQAKENQLRTLKHQGGDKPMKQGGMVKLADLEAMDIITFATEVLNISFKERPAQEVILRSMYGLPLTPEQVILYNLMTHRPEDIDFAFEENVEKSEAVWAIGARAGKSILSSIIALFESICRAHIWKQYLQKGESGYAVIVATRLTQCEQIIQAGCSRLLQDSKISYLIKGQPLQSELTLTNGMKIASFPCNSTAARGLPIFCLVFDELAHWRIEGVKADEIIYNSLRPRQAQFPQAKMLKISTPSAKQGLLWQEFSEGFQVPDRLTIQAETRLVNPEIPQEFIDKEYLRDVDNAAREFGAIFAEQVAGFFAGCESELSDCFQLAGDMSYNGKYAYTGAIDQSGLSGRDRFGFSIAHKEDGKCIVDIVRSWQTKDADEILKNIGKLCIKYHVRKIYRDRFAAGWVEQALLKIEGIIESPAREFLPVVYSNLKSLVIAGLLSDTKFCCLGAAENIQPV